MNSHATLEWTDANQRHMAAEFVALRRQLGETEAPTSDPRGARVELPEPAAIDRLVEVFRLSRFERSVLLLAAGVEMDSALARLVPRVTFGLALGAFEGAHWSAIGPTAPLRAWRLIELDDASPTQARVRIDERILHYLAGINRIDARLLPLLRPHDPPTLMAATHRVEVDRLLDEIARAEATSAVVQMSGDDEDGQSDVAAAVAHATGRFSFSLSQADIPVLAGEQEALAVLWQREAALLPATLLIEVDEAQEPGHATLVRFIQRLRCPVFVAARESSGVPAHFAARIDKPNADTQCALWLRALGETPPPALRELVRAVAAQFRLSTATIRRRAANIAATIEDPAHPAALWRECCELARPRMDELAQRVSSTAGWDDLILPEAQLSVLHQLAGQVRQRVRVYEDWGFGSKGRRGLGISALFCGESGVGKTMACEVLARELELDLYRIDLSSVVSKYIGETEKNLRRVFDAAEDSGAILLFDEADALFGKRSEVKDSHDRYANIEVGYLLQRMESYRGLAVLTTNMRAALDPAFLRRLRFVVQFPFPDQALREAIWRRTFPDNMPQRDIDIAKLGRLQMTGGHIRNIALNAAFLASEADEPVSMAHLARAAHHEAAKIERPLAENQTRGWM